jgi:hypothetical protein
MPIPGAGWPALEPPGPLYAPRPPRRWDLAAWVLLFALGTPAALLLGIHLGINLARP